jgi:hypothetical protein
MDSVPSGSDPENSGEAQGRRSPLTVFGDGKRHLQSLIENLQLENEIRSSLLIVSVRLP